MSKSKIKRIAVTITEKQFLANLTKKERRYLSGRICRLCELPIDRKGCLAISTNACTEQSRNERRMRCLREYKPRKMKSKENSSGSV